MCDFETEVDGFDLGQSDDECGDGYFNDLMSIGLTEEECADVLNFF